ncbi:hypothetical protein LEP1GSC188_1009 [Leptospira weilii serovar Topaz str. LT2116]|uniref:Uncharacterized protein n=1 Tax=Leptospira weilii serovar Topaz str. LT2116 TaxID=1088540 RepID=M3EGY9_9LEPT|nr:hypothetical protein LEP1GSC188_1009 [Leptospira weilii serovar Topaz str. LT2116]
MTGKIGSITVRKKHGLWSQILKDGVGRLLFQLKDSNKTKNLS